MLQAEYIKDMHNHYLVLKGIEGNASGFVVKMLLNNTIHGLLKMEQRCIDQMDLFYYDITSLKPLSSMYESKSLNYCEIKSLLCNILETIEHSGEYLISENDFIIKPDYIYMDTVTQAARLCLLVGYQEKIQEQICRFIEYLLNKVDYKDERAVLLIYELYKESKEKDCTFKKLLYVINQKITKEDSNIHAEQNQESVKFQTTGSSEINLKARNTNQDNSHIKESKESKERKESKEIKDSNIRKRNHILESKKGTSIKRNKFKETKRKNLKNDKINNKNNKNYDITKNKNKIKWNDANGKRNASMDQLKNKEEQHFFDEILNEFEIAYYDKTTYILAGVCFVFGIVLFAGLIQLKLLHNSFGTHLDIIKVLCCIIIIIVLEIFLMIKLFCKNNRITRMETKLEYVESTQEVEELSQDEKWDSIYINQDEENNNGETQILWINESNMDQNETVVLYEKTERKQYCLEACLDKTIVPIHTYPFIVGKSQNGVNFTIIDTAISRLHAKIINEGEDFYLIDLSSTNGTYLNNLKLTDNKLYKLSNEDEIIFSHLKYQWKERVS